MPRLEHYVGQVLDEKYRLEQLLGQGGMGAVYLATHLGTERYVALKLIAPQFMRNQEFVERFKREARAAGRLRHPNVVDVTDFGFARVDEGQVAYLVMEYLDGCTLGDVLSEEKRLPLEWVVDILEQVCSALQEAHQLGIIHRDLKPDNIWLEPNRLGGYRVKVLDFGIAKLADASAPVSAEMDSVTGLEVRAPGTPTAASRSTPLSDASNSVPPLAVENLEGATLLQPKGDELRTQQLKPAGNGGVTRIQAESLPEMENVEEEAATKFFSPPTVHRGTARSTVVQAQRKDEDDDGTLLFSEAPHSSSSRTAHISTNFQGSALTRVGAIMGTPLYMSPEQCGGGNVDVRSDIYSLGVITYQMLAGEPPFAGDTTTVLQAHREQTARHLSEHEVKIPKRVAGVVMSALAKNPDERPQSAFAFASVLRGQADGIGALYRRAFSLYSEYFPKFLKLSFLAHLPVIVVTVLMVAATTADKLLPKGGLPQKIVTICVIVTLVLAQIAAYFFATAVISGVTAIIITQLTAAPLRPVELRAAFLVLKKRWKPFLKTMLRVTIRILIGYVLLIIPGIIISIRYALYAPVVLIEGLEKKAAMKRARELAARSWRTVIIVSILQILIPMIVSLLLGRIRFVVGEDIKHVGLGRQISQQLMGLVNIFVIPLMAIVPALLYLKMRQLGGESLSAALAQIEEGTVEGSQWRQRMRTRLSLHTPSGQRTPISREPRPPAS